MKSEDFGQHIYHKKITKLFENASIFGMKIIVDENIVGWYVK